MTKIYNRTKDKEKRKLLRQNMTDAEKIMWNILRKRQLFNHRFRRQYSIRGFVVDFYCPQIKTAIEIDGDYHLETDAKIYDKERQKLLESLGINFIRFSNDDVFCNISKVINRLKVLLPLSKGEKKRG
ncbi:endonuclease domain-containing protein [Candidatus Saganbacteria bacterium]|nr:endonuclease domain-containing protein [Candidatus Saganbacteria bacterium]